MDQNIGYANRVKGAQGKSDQPTVTFMTTKAIVFYVSAVAAVVCMFLNWLPLDVDLANYKMENVLGTVNVFSLPGALNELNESVGVLGNLLPSDVTSAFGTVRFVSYLLMAIAVAAIGLYVFAIYLRLKEQDKSVKIGRTAAVLVGICAAGFVVLAVSVVSKLGISGGAMEIAGVVLKSPCAVTLVCAVISFFCAVMNMEFKENVVIYHDGTMKIDRGPKWKCRACGRNNLSLLERCYYCGKEK